MDELSSLRKLKQEESQTKELRKKRRIEDAEYNAHWNEEWKGLSEAFDTWTIDRSEAKSDELAGQIVRIAEFLHGHGLDGHVERARENLRGMFTVDKSGQRVGLCDIWETFALVVLIDEAIQDANAAKAKSGLSAICYDSGPGAADSAQWEICHAFNRTMLFVGNPVQIKHGDNSATTLPSDNGGAIQGDSIASADPEVETSNLHVVLNDAQCASDELRHEEGQRAQEWEQLQDIRAEHSHYRKLYYDLSHYESYAPAQFIELVKEFLGLMTMEQAQWLERIQGDEARDFSTKRLNQDGVASGKVFQVAVGILAAVAHHQSHEATKLWEDSSSTVRGFTVSIIQRLDDWLHGRYPQPTPNTGGSPSVASQIPDDLKSWVLDIVYLEQEEPKARDEQRPLHSIPRRNAIRQRSRDNKAKWEQAKKLADIILANGNNPAN